MRLSENFTLAEFTRSATAQRLNLNNQPPPHIVQVLKATADRMERVRSILGGQPLTITSGYRTLEVNRAAGGAANSDHMTGLAVDFTHPRFTPARAASELEASRLQFDQLIIYEQHLHIGFGRRMRREVLDFRRRR